MSSLTSSTRRRLLNLRQIPSVWEGDRRPLVSNSAISDEIDSDLQGDCILWVDGVEEIVRAMDVVPPETGPEAIVRTLLRAMETPHGSNTRPGRPQRIIVRDREIQFFLRGVLQDLDINVDYAPELPLIDEIFRGLQEVANNRPPQLPTEFADALSAIAYDLWEDAPWDVLDEEKILAVELNIGDVGTLYVSILGMLGMEYGILLYRSVESLKNFRQRVLSAEEATDQLERAFLEQDCFFLTFDQTSGALNGNGSTQESVYGVRPTFGLLHPLEGMRPVLYEEEAIAVLLALTGLHKFFQQHLTELDVGHFPAMNSRYRIPDPRDTKKKLPVKVSTLPELADELFRMSADLESDDDLDEMNGNLIPVLHSDLMPADAHYSLGAMPYELVDPLRKLVKHHQPSDKALPKDLEWFPVILIQTSRPKALAMIEAIKSANGLDGICFNPGEDPFSDERYDLGILKTLNGDLHLFGEFIEDDPIHIEARKKWDQRCKKTKGQCGLIIAKGVTGLSKGNPKLTDMLALFEAKAISDKELGLGLLELVRHYD